MILEPAAVTQLPAPLCGAVRKLLRLEPLDRHYSAARALPAREFAERMLAELGVTFHMEARDLSHIPATGPVILAANHPFGLLEGLLLYALLPRVRPDFAVLANAVLNDLPELREHLIPVEVFAGDHSNSGPLRKAARVLARGGLVAIFPAGEVASLRWSEAAVGDAAWSRSAPWLAARTGAPVVPFYFAGANSAMFQLAGLLHPKLRTLRLPAELINKRGRTVLMRAARPVTTETLSGVGDLTAQAEFLRARSHWLGERRATASLASPRVVPAPTAPPDVAREVNRLPPNARLAEMGGYTAYRTRSGQSPAVVTEIGRLREEAFRAVGEGTGAPTDIDTFDAHYEHLFVWNQAAREIVGAYRLAETRTVLARQGLAGLYTRTLFHYGVEFLDRLGPALEVGRSFVRPAYQRERAPLLLLWRGLAQYALRMAPVLFGAVSMSNEYHPLSRQLVHAYLAGQAARDPLSRLVRARRPFREALKRPELLGGCRTLENVSELIEDIETSAKGVPVLIRQYAKLGARPLAFHVDRTFGDTLDCLIAVDLSQADDRALRPFLPAEEDRKRMAAAGDANWRNDGSPRECGRRGLTQGRALQRR